MKTELYQNNTNKWSQSFSTLKLIFFFFPPFISFLGLYLYIFHQNWGGENPIKLWRGTVPLVFLLSCWNWVYKECEKSLRSCTVRLFTKWTMPHLRFSDCPRKYASGSQFDSFCLSRVCKSPSWSRAVFCFGSWCLIQKIVSFFFFFKFSLPKVVHVQTRIWFDGSCCWKSLLVHFSSRNSVM